MATRTTPSIEPATAERRIAAAAAVGGPALLLASTVAYVATGDFNVGEAAGTLQIWAGAVYLVALVHLARRLSGSSPLLGGALGVLAAIGSAGMVAYGMDAIQQDLSGASIVGSAATAFALRVPGLCFPIALLVGGIALARRNLAPAAAAWALVVAAVLFPLGRIGNVLALGVASDVLGLLAMAAIARAWWAAPRRPVVPAPAPAPA